MEIADAIVRCAESPAETNRRGEIPGNVADALYAIAHALERLAHSVETANRR